MMRQVPKARSNMRFVLAGNERIGYECLKILLQEKQQVVAVITDRNNQKSKLENKRLKYLASQSGLKLLEVEDINDPGLLRELRSLAPDVLFNLALLHIYKAPVLAIPRLGCINFHPGPLPRYGGSNGWVWAIINGETEYGVTYHYMDERVDAGDIVAMQRFPIGKDDTGLSLLMKCYDQGASLFRKVLGEILEENVVSTSQEQHGRSYFYNRVPYDGIIDTGWNAARIRDFVRALDFSPFPNPLSPPMVIFEGAKLIVTKAEVVDWVMTPPKKPGVVIDINQHGVVMQSGDGLVLLALSDPALRSSDSEEVCISKGIAKGSVLGSRGLVV